MESEPPECSKSWLATVVETKQIGSDIEDETKNRNCHLHKVLQ